MSTVSTLFNELADHLDAMSATLRRHAEPETETTRPDPPTTVPEDPMALARSAHPSIGQRQEQILQEIIKAHPEGVSAGEISRALQYDQANTYLTADALVKHGLARKDTSVHPQRYHLGRRLLGG